MADYECWRSADDIAEPGTMVEARSARQAAESFVSESDSFGNEDFESCVVRDEDGDLIEFLFGTEVVTTVSYRKSTILGMYDELVARIREGE